MSDSKSTDPAAQLQELEDRILAAIEDAERARKLPSLSHNAKRALLLELRKLKEEAGFIDGAHRLWPDLREKRQEAARARIVRSYEPFTGLPSDHDRFYCREIPNEALFVMTEQNAVETIDWVGRAETHKLLVKSFEKIVGVYGTMWSTAPDPRCEEFSKWIPPIRSLTIAAFCEEWLGRRLAERPSADGFVEFAGLPPLWFEHLPLKDADGLKGEADAACSIAREYELQFRTQATAEAVLAEPAAAAPAPAPERRQFEALLLEAIRGQANRTTSAVEASRPATPPDAGTLEAGSTAASAATTREPPAPAEADFGTKMEDPLSAEKAARHRLIDEYKTECRRHGTHTNYEIIAHAVNKRWGSRTQIEKWLACDPRYGGEVDRQIRAYLTSETERLKKIR
jgi:hypothetical protein